MARPAALPALEPVVVTGAALGLPGTEQTFADDNVARILAGQNFISVLGEGTRQRMADMRITRLVKDATSGAGSFATIDDPADVIKLAGVHAPLDVVAQFGVDTARDEALDTTTRMAIGAGFDALRDAGIPLVMSYKTTTLGTQLPDRWGLPEALRDETGVIFASAFPGYDRFAEAVEGYALDRGRREGLLAVEGLRARMAEGDPARAEVDTVITELRETLEREPYQFDRRFLFRALSMGHSQFAEIIGARGPNTQVNAACASATQALSLAEDWIRAGRCRRVVVVSADDATGTHLMPWVTAGFLASGAAATDERVEDAATPFDRRRHGMVVGAGAAAFVVESAEAARERGLQPIAEALATVTANSAFHGSRLDVQHICDVMEALVREAEGRGVDRRAIAPHLMFVSHETYTPARGGSAAAEINALRRVFGPGRRPDRHHQHQGLHRARHGRRHRGRRGAQGARDGDRAAGAELPGAGPRPRRPQPLHRRRLPGAVRAAPGCGLRLAGRHVAAALDPRARRQAAPARRARLRLPGRRPGCVAALAGPARRPHRRAGSRSTTGACASSTRARPPSRSSGRGTCRCRMPTGSPRRPASPSPAARPSPRHRPRRRHRRP